MTFAVFGLGPTEILVLLLLGGLCFGGVTAGIVIIVVASTRKRNRNQSLDEQAMLERENRRLREEIAKMKKEGP